MGLFSKKECDVCKKKMALMEGYKCADGTICNDCKKKMSPLFTDTTKTQQ
jgi:CRISPR/Cas system-associated protein Cas10 (large subunit of type III CRISPR-Cas system)